MTPYFAYFSLKSITKGSFSEKTLTFWRVRRWCGCSTFVPYGVRARLANSQATYRRLWNISQYLTDRAKTVGEEAGPGLIGTLGTGRTD